MEVLNVSDNAVKIAKPADVEAAVQVMDAAGRPVPRLRDREVEWSSMPLAPMERRGITMYDLALQYDLRPGQYRLQYVMPTPREPNAMMLPSSNVAEFVVGPAPDCPPEPGSTSMPAREPG